MFTGLIETMGSVVQVKRSGTAATLTVSAVFDGDAVRIGDSIAVNGVCLTVISMSADLFSFDVSPETLDRTSLRAARPGARLNLERALRLSDRLGGHIVSGHVDCVATITQRRQESGNILFFFRLPREFTRYLVEKGSVAIDGISLTVNSVDDTGFSVNIIPHTASQTTLHLRNPGDEVNIETDILAKYVERLFLGRTSVEAPGVTLELLAKNGFV